MNWSALIFRNIRFHARANLGVAIGAALATAILTGALLVGDSMRWSLRHMALERLGNIQYSLASGDRFFRAALAQEISSEVNVPTAPAILLSGSLRSPDGSNAVNRVQVLGVDSSFWTLAEQQLQGVAWNEDTILLNEPLASKLGAHAGDTFLLRLPKPSQLSREAPISSQENATTTLRMRVGAIVNSSQLGHFQLRSVQELPLQCLDSTQPSAKTARLHKSGQPIISGATR